MTDAIRDAYDRSAPAWLRGPARLYAPLAEALLDHAPFPVAGAAVLDAGAGTGVAGDAARRRGAQRVVGVDLAVGMLAAPGAAGAAVAADLSRLPFRDSTFDLAVAAFSLGHLPDPVTALRELRRTAPVLLASAFVTGWTHPAKEVVEQVLTRRGFRSPAWYVSFKVGAERELGEAGRLADLAGAAGFGEVVVRRTDVATDVVAPADLVSWRLGMAHHAPFVAGLAPAVREEVREEAERLVVGTPPVVVPMLVLIAT